MAQRCFPVVYADQAERSAAFYGNPVALAVAAP
jgi:hypothetical protein